MEADIELWTSLRERGVSVDALVLPGETHWFLLWSNRLKALEATSAFFDRQFSSGGH
jgi:dipeptidyl aminopeptidase/acylaminoacyl peptidase